MIKKLLTPDMHFPCFIRLSQLGKSSLLTHVTHWHTLCLTAISDQIGAKNIHQDQICLAMISVFYLLYDQFFIAQINSNRPIHYAGDHLTYLHIKYHWWWFVWTIFQNQANKSLCQRKLEKHLYSHDV